MIHGLKQLPEYFKAVKNGTKTFEVRKNDRNYQVGDLLALNEYDGEKYTGRHCIVRVLYILDNSEYVKDGYIIMGIEKTTDSFAARFVAGISCPPNL